MRALLAVACLVSPLAAQGPTQGAFLVRLGRDTVAVEQFTRTATLVQGEVVAFVPTTRTIRYTLHLTAGGTVHAAEYQVLPGAGAPGTAATLTASLVRADSVGVVILRRAQGTDTLRVPMRAGTVPMLAPSIVSYEQMIRQAMRQGGDSVRIDLYSVGSRAAVPNAVVRRTADSVSVFYGPDPHYIATDPDGNLLGLNGARTTNKMTVSRLREPVDIQALAAAGVARERAGTAPGPLSARDTVRAQVGRAELVVDYGRPLTRGRQILGTVVPFGQVWRTGANTATHFTTSGDLILGGTPVPAGTYTLWTLPTESGVQLIVNRQTGQWGTIYDAGQDLARIPVEVQGARTPVERFTITVEPREGGGGILVMAWHTFVWRVPFTAP